MPSVFHSGIAPPVTNLQDIGVLPCRAERKGIQIAKTPGEVDLLIFFQVLLAKENDLSFEENVANELSLLGNIRPPEVDPVDHGADRDAQVLEFEAMLFSSRLKPRGDGTVPHALVLESNTQTRTIKRRK